MDCTVCGHYEEELCNTKECQDCKSFYTGKTDDGRFYRCDNKKFREITGGSDSVKPEFGCIYFEKL